MKIGRLFFLIPLALLLQSVGFAQGSDSVFFTNGFKVGEVTENSAVIWTRLCAQEFPGPVRHERKDPPFRSPLGFDDSLLVEEMDGAVKGVFGQVRIQLISGEEISAGDWEYVSGYKDYTLKKNLDKLLPSTLYKVKIQGRRKSDSPVSEISGHFRTAASETEALPVTFTSSSCQYFWDFDDPERGFRIYDAMLKHRPDFHCHTGDFVYYDKPGPLAVNVELARHKWHANNAWPSLREFYAQTPIYLQKDDHDTMFDDASPHKEAFGELSFQDGLAIWYEQAPLEGKPYRTFRRGKDLQIWLVEGREYRSDNWLTDGPDRSKGKNDNHANQAFETEGNWLRNFLGEHSVFVINGDRHWQYVSEDEESGVLEFSQGPSSDSHAQGWSQDDRRWEHKFLRVKGGFLVVEVYRKEKQPYITFTHCDVNGAVVNEKTISTN